MTVKFREVPIGYCAFCKEQLKLIEPVDKIEPYWECDCEEWRLKNNIINLI